MTSSSNPSPSPDLEEGIDVRSTAVAFLVFAGFAVAVSVIGFQVSNFGLLFAGLPVSAVFTTLGGEFVLAWPVDTVVWILFASWPGRQQGYLDRRWWKIVAVVLVAALVYGQLMGVLVEPTAGFE